MMRALGRLRGALAFARTNPRYALLELRLVPARAQLVVRAKLNSGAYRMLSEQELRTRRHSDTVFVFGSGWSINELTPPEIARFEAHDTLTFNWFVRQDVVRADFHLIREIPEDDLDPQVWRPQVDEYFGLIRESARYDRTIFLVQTGFRAINGNRAVAERLLPGGSEIFLWRSAAGRPELGRTFAEGLSHCHGTLEECVNFAVLAGWRRIVLVGVDLYDRRYFWLGSNETRSTDAQRGATHESRHATAASGMIENFARWGAQLRREGVELLVYNPRSLLAPVLDVYAQTR